MYINIEQLVKDELEATEQLLWYEQPKAKIITAGGSVLCIFGIAFAVFSLFWMTTLLEQQSQAMLAVSLMDKIFPFFSAPFLIIGVLLMLSPYWIYRRAKRTVYAITNSRCIIITAGRTKKVESYNTDTIGNIEKVQYSNGFGDLTFAKEQYTMSGNDSGTEVRMRSIGFYNICEVNKVEKILKAAVRKDVG
ncbi:MAG: hypothetical protein N3B21_02350 [Clostridia bacterium]|nr:hypothetical protein [Clostridia bacterium]